MFFTIFLAWLLHRDVHFSWGPNFLFSFYLGFGYLGRFPFNPKVRKFRLVHQMERTISVWSDRNIWDQLWRWSTVTGLVISVGRTENNWRNVTRRWKKVCAIKLQFCKSPWESAYYLSEACRRYLTKTIYQLRWNEYNKAWLNTNWLKHRIYSPYSSRNCFESFEYSEKRIASIHKNFLHALAFIGFLHEIGFLSL